jgi:hypothetical protein
MDLVIKNLKRKPLSGNDIYNACENNIKILKYGELNKFDTIDDAFDPFDAIALLYETHKNFGHWVLLLRHKNKKTIEFFDSYGGFIDDPLKKIGGEFKKKTGQDGHKLSKLLADSKYKIIYNPVQIQKLKEGVSSCGRHLCLRYLMRDIPMTKYLNVLQDSDKNNTDDIVTYLTAFI